MQSVAVLGATGSIGSSALAVIQQHQGRLQASILSAHTRVHDLINACRIYRPSHAVITDPSFYCALKQGLSDAGLATQAHCGHDTLSSLVASDACTTVVAGIVGFAGLHSTLAAAKAGKRILLANKEALVVSGRLLMEAAKHNNTSQIIPVDSEHNAIFQCLRACSIDTVQRIILTASGGPFRGWNKTALEKVTVQQAIAHPIWSMGKKIAIDSATMMNKGLEIIEAHYLFAIALDGIDVLIHPQSLVHSMVEYINGSTLAQLGLPDMRTSLAVGFGWPHVIASGVQGLDLRKHGRLDFEEPDHATFPCLGLARQALAMGGTAPAVLNAANETAVAAFLQGRIRFTDIPHFVEWALERRENLPHPDLDTLESVDAYTRKTVLSAVSTLPYS